MTYSSAVARAVATVVLGLALAAPAHAAFPGENGRIVFLRQGAGSHIWAMNPDGSGHAQLTDSGFNQDPDVSPDGRRIVFVRAVGGQVNIWVMNSDGTGQTKLVDDDVFREQPSWSPDGGKIVFRYDDGLGVMNADGTGEARLTQAFDAHPVWSPDGTTIAFTRIGSDYEIYAIDADGSDPRNLTSHPGGNESFPEWSPDGQRIAYTGGDHGEFADIHAMNADGSGKERLTDDPDIDLQPAWSPAGDKIAFASVRTGNTEIWLMNPDGTAQSQLTDHFAAENSPSWGPSPSPDAPSCEDDRTGAQEPGPVSGPVHDLEGPAGALSPPFGATVHGVNCQVIVPLGL